MRLYFAQEHMNQRDQKNLSSNMEKGIICSLEITIISAEGLGLGGHSAKKNTFVTVKTDSDNQRSTSMGKEAGSNNISWNEKLEPPLVLPSSIQLLAVDVQTRMSSGKVRIIGTSKVPISDFIGDYTPSQYLHFLSYRLRDCNGESNGIISFSIKTVGLQSFAAAWPVLPSRPFGFPATANQKIDSPAACGSASGSASGAAIGIPVPVPYDHG